MIPDTGERALIVGQTGSGKTAFATWLLDQIEQTPFIIYDTKREPKFDAMRASRRVYNQNGVEEALNDEAVDYVIYEPAMEIVADTSALDHLLWEHYNRYQGVGAYIDEVTNFNPGPWKTEKGMLSILSRGRSKGITTVMSTQRPKGLAVPCLTEAQHFYIFSITDQRDNKRFDDFLENFSKLPRLTVGEHKFYYKAIGKPGEPELYNPVPIDNSLIGYVDNQVDSVSSGADDDTQSGPSENSLIWL